MILPVFALAAGGFFSSVYARRTFFLVFASDDHVDLAEAKGLSSRAIEGRYILRPTLPTIITQFVLMIIVMWQGAIIPEQVFKWPGLGTLYMEAANVNDTPTVVGVIVICDCLLALSVFLLDFIYTIVDPRVRVGTGARTRS